MCRAIEKTNPSFSPRQANAEPDPQRGSNSAYGGTDLHRWQHPKDIMSALQAVNPCLQA